MVFHVLKDGSRPTDITGHIVRVSEAETFYQLLDTMNRGGSVADKTNTYEQGKTR